MAFTMGRPSSSLFSFYQGTRDAKSNVKPVNAAEAATKTVSDLLALGSIRKLVNPQRDLVVVVIPYGKAVPGDGEFMLLMSYEPTNWAEHRAAITAELSRSVRPVIIEGVPRTYTEVVKLVPGARNNARITQNQAAAWYINRLSSEMGLSTMADKVIEHVARYQRLVENGRELIFRGEAELYANPCRSTLSRYISSTDPGILKKAVEQQEFSIRKKTGRNIELIGPVMQQAGGLSNTIDFSESPLTALWFATHRSDGSISDTDGVVWLMDGRLKSYNPFRSSPKMKFHKGSDISTSDVEARIAAQQSILVESETGEVPHGERTVICEVPASSKPDISRFLQRIGLTKNTIIPELLSEVAVAERSVGLDVTLEVVREKLRNGDSLKARQICIEWTRQHANPSIEQACVVYYYLGVATGLLGQASEGLRILSHVAEECRKRSSRIPSVLGKNMNHFRIAQKSEDYSRLRKLVDVTTPYMHPLGEPLFHSRLVTRDNSNLNSEIQAAIEFHRKQKANLPSA